MTSTSTIITLRETEILKLIAEDKSAKEIAHSLNITISTVKNHRANIMKKLGVHSTVLLVHHAIREGICPMLGPFPFLPLA